LFAFLAVLWTVPPEVHPLGAVLAFALLAALSLAVVSASGATRSERRFLILLLIPLALSLPAALNAGAAVDRILLLGGALMVFVAGRRLPAAAARGVILLLVAGGALLAVHGMWQYFYGLPQLLNGLDPDSAAVSRLRTLRVFSRFMLPSVFASFLLLALPMALALARESRRARRLAALAAAAAMVAGLLLTRSHGALVALLATVVLWRLLTGRRRPVLTAAILALLLAGMGLVAWSRGGVLVADASGQGPAALRLRNSAMAVSMMVDHPVQGLGGGGYGAAYPSYRQPGDNETHFVHNSYLQLMVEHGLTMAVPLALILLAWGRRVRLSLRGNSAVETGLALGLSAFLLHNLIDFSALLPSTLWTAAVLAGIAAGPPRPHKEGETAPRSRRLVPVAVALAVTLLAAGAGMATGLSRHRLEMAQRQVTAGNLKEALADSRRAWAWAPWRAEPYLLEAEILVRHPDLAGPDAGWMAWQAASRALRRAPAWPAAHGVRASAAAMMGQPGLAASDLHRAAELYPMAAGYPRQLDSLQSRLPGGGGVAQ
jgi:O-antigen ligase